MLNSKGVVKTKFIGNLSHEARNPLMGSKLIFYRHEYLVKF